MTREEEAADLLRLVRDPHPREFFRRLKIEPREGGPPILFNDLTPEQEDMTEKRLTYQQNAFLKSRNVGAGLHTQAFDFWFVWRHAWQGIPLNTLLESHADITYKRHVARVRALNASLPRHLRLLMVTDKIEGVEFKVPGTELVSKFHGVTSAGKKGEGRGDTYHRAHFTEFAFYGDGGGVLGSVMSAMHRGPYRSITIESTPNGPEGDFPRLFDLWTETSASGKCSTFYPWTMNPTHVAPLPTHEAAYDYSLDQVERELVAIHGATLQNIEWRREKLETMTLESFRKEYPVSVEEAFSGSGEGYFGGETIKRVAVRTKGKLPTGWRVFAPPVSGLRYAVALDVGGGVGGQGDDSVIQVINERLEQVAVWSDNVTKPSYVGELAWDTACRYNGALLLVEDNVIGMIARMRIEEIGGRVYHENGRPFHLHGSQSGGNKAPMFAHAKLILDRDRCKVHDTQTARQLLAIRIAHTTSGHPVFESRGKAKDDHAMAFVEALWVARHIRTSAQDRMNSLLKQTQTGPRVFDRFAHGVRR